MRRSSSSLVLAGVAGTALLAVGAALVSQHVFDMQPCPWCVLQRLLFVVLALGAGVAALRPRGSAPRRVGAGLATLAGLAGLAAALYQNLVASKSVSCNRTLADRIIEGLHLHTLVPEVFEVRASCADAAVALLGVPYERWSAALFALLGALSLRALIVRS